MTYTYSELRQSAEEGLLVLVMPCTLPDGHPAVDVFGFKLFAKYKRRATASSGYALGLTLRVAQMRRDALAKTGVTFA